MGIKEIRQKKIVFLTGAGVSAESGLATFRGKNGLWNNEEWQYLASTDGMYYDTEKSLEFYNWRREQLSEVSPNRAHLLIAELEKDNNVTVITQNVDDLHERAGSSNVIHLHGELRKVCSSKNRYDPAYIRDYQLTIPIKVGDDAGDGSQLRPHVVLFGEYVFGMEEAETAVSRADIFVVIGTSLMVYPANNLILYANKEIPKFVIDPNDMPKCEQLGFIHIRESASKGMEILLKKIVDVQREHNSFLPFPWKDVEACSDRKTKPLCGEKSCPICGRCSTELKWINFISPEWTWKEKCGVEGLLSICTNCHIQVQFICEGIC